MLRVLLCQVRSCTSWLLAMYSEIALATRQYVLALLTSLQLPGICMSIAPLRYRAFGICEYSLRKPGSHNLWKEKSVFWVLVCSLAYYFVKFQLGTSEHRLR